MGLVSGHGGGDDGDDEEVEKYEGAGIRWRRATSELLCSVLIQTKTTMQALIWIQNIY